MKTLFLLCLAIAWAAILVPVLLRKVREGRPTSSVVMFRQQLSTLERATPGSHLRPVSYRSTPLAPPVMGPLRGVPMTRNDVQRRRFEVLVALAALTGVTLLAALVVQGIAVLLFLGSAALLGGYVYALVQLRKRATEATHKVRVLRPQGRQLAPARLALRHSAAN